jgi:hypothetical protein
VVHATAIHIVGEVIEIVQACWLGVRIAFTSPDEIHIPDRACVHRMVGVAVHEIQQRAADAPDGRNVQFHRPHLADEGFCPKTDCTLVGGLRIDHAEGHGAGAGAVLAGELLREAVAFGIDDVVHVALPVERHILGAMFGHRRETHQAEGLVECHRIGVREFHELETVGPHRVGSGDGRSWCVEGEGSHGRLSSRE